MSYQQNVAFCPVRTNLDISNVQFSNFSNVQYTQLHLTDSEGEAEPGKTAEGTLYMLDMEYALNGHMPMKLIKTNTAK